MGHIHDLIKFYYMLGLRHGEILLLSTAVDDIVISMRTLRRILKWMELYRRKNESQPKHKVGSSFKQEFHVLTR